MSGTLEMLPGNIDFSNEQHSAVSIGISYFKFKIIPGKLFGDGEENFSFSELGLIISGYVCCIESTLQTLNKKIMID